MNDMPHIPGLIPQSIRDEPGIKLMRCINRSGGDLSAGDWVILDETASYNALGTLPSAKTATCASGRVLGCVADGVSTTPNGGELIVQIQGLHPTAKVNNTGGALAAGDCIGTSDTAKIGAKVTGAELRGGIYVDGAYDSSATAAKKVIITNNLGIAPD